MHGRGNKGEEVPLAAETRHGEEREEINADCYSRNLMRSHLPGTWPALVCARASQSPLTPFVEMAKDVPAAHSLGFTNLPPGLEKVTPRLPLTPRLLDLRPIQTAFCASLLRLRF